MPLFLIGLGLGDEKDITLRGLEAVKDADDVYLEEYTSIFCNTNCDRLTEFYGRPVIPADREAVESGQVIDSLIGEGADPNRKVAVLIVGDPLGATTHCDLAHRCREAGVEVQVVHNASVMTAIGICGLQLYRFGEAISLCFWTETWRPTSYFFKIRDNMLRGLHTLCLLDIKVKEQTAENLARGRMIFEPPRFMTVAQGASQLLEAAEMANKRIKWSATAPTVAVEASPRDSADSDASDVPPTPTPNTGGLVLLDDGALVSGAAAAAACGPYGVCGGSIAVGLARLGNATQKVVVAPLRELAEMDFGGPLHCVILVGDADVSECEFMSAFATGATKEALLQRVREH